MKRLLNSLIVIEIALLLVVTTLTYLPNLLKATIYRDDWYYTYDRMVGGPQTFHYMFSIDRPARGYLFEAYYRLFGINPQPYHLVAYGWRVLLGLLAFWLFSLLWPGEPLAPLIMALLLVIFPGYTRFMEGMEDQPNIICLVLMVTSFALTLKAIRTKSLLGRIALWAASILTGWGYLGLVDYAMGMEVFRFLCVLVLIQHSLHIRSWLHKGIAVLRNAAPGLLVLGGYFFWRVVLFHNQRAETSITGQIQKVIADPIPGLEYWFTHFIQSLINEAIVAWSGYGIQSFFKLNTSQFFTGLLTALVVTACVALAFFWIGKHTVTKPVSTDIVPYYWPSEAITIGFIGVIAGVLPVVLANRGVEFGILSHYSVPASLASAVLVSGLMGSISSSRLRLSTISMIVLLAVITQYTFSIQVANEEKILNNFWHQLAWRAPGIRPATGLLVNYPGVTIGEDVDYVHGPANLIYFPQPVNQSFPLRYNLFAIKQYPWTVKEFIAGGKVTDGYRTHYGVVDYNYILVISQPTVDSCVHIIDQQWPWFSFDDLDTVLVLGQHSNVRNVITQTTPPQLPPTIFGPEPVHGWCFYFEKAELALQQKDWLGISALGAEVSRLNFSPNNSLEWMPFLQADAILGNESSFSATLPKMIQSGFNRVQVCNVLTKMQQNGMKFMPGIQNLISSKVCL